MPRDAARLKKHVALLFDRLLKGGKLSLVPQAIRPIPKSEALKKAAADDEHDPGLAVNGDDTDGLPREQKPTAVSPPPPSAEAAAMAVAAVVSQAAASKRKTRLSPLPEVAAGPTV